MSGPIISHTPPDIADPVMKVICFCQSHLSSQSEGVSYDKMYGLLAERHEHFGPGVSPHDFFQWADYWGFFRMDPERRMLYPVDKDKHQPGQPALATGR